MKKIEFFIKNDNNKTRENIKKINNNLSKINIDNKINIHDSSYNFDNIIDSHSIQLNLIQKLFLDEDFIEKKYIINELKNKINSYKQQDIKKNIYEENNLITLEEVIEKLLISKLKCYYCKKNMFIFFAKVRDNSQWTLDRLNNYDVHNNSNTIVCCLECNLQRRRKSSEKFKFSKQLATNQITINKLE